MQAFLSLMRRAAALPVLLACAALFTLMVMTFADVLLRSALNAPIEAASELTRVLMAVIVFSVLPIISATGEHISVDLSDGLFDRFGLGRARDALVHVACGVMLIWPAQRVWVLAERARDYGDVTEYLGMPLFYIGWFIAASVALTALVLVVTGVIHAVAPKLLNKERGT